MKSNWSIFLKLSVLFLLLFTFSERASLVFSQSDNEFDSEINNLNVQIGLQKQQIDALRKRQQEYQVQIKAKQKDQLSLNKQLEIIEDKLAQTMLDVESANLEIDKTNLEMRKLEIDGNNLDKKIDERKEHIANLLRTLYQQDQISSLEILLLNDSLAEFLNQVKYLESTNQKVIEGVELLKEDRVKLENNKLSLEQKTKEILDLKVKLEEKKNNLAYEQDNKTYILEETRSSEKQYQNLLLAAKREQQQAETEINRAEQLIRQKMSEKEKNKLNNGNNTIAWPITKNVITATFHDPDYPYRRLIGEHSGVDIRAKQGTTIKAAADGYVAKVKFDGNKSYAYIMLIHGDGLATVYGHVSAVYVLVDQYVKQGQLIGASGGMPGGVGSGGFSSGPHLHFEVRSNGLPVNPSNYLP